MRRSLFHAGLALLLVPLTIFLVLKKVPEPARGVLTFPNPTHRVAVAVNEAMKAELASVTAGEFDMSLDYQVLNPGGTPIKRINGVPEDDSSFLFPVQGLPGPKTTGQSLMILEQMDFEGQTRDGRKVKVTVKTDPIAEGSVVDFHGDEVLARAMSSKINKRLANPKTKLGTPEDSAALVAFFNLTNTPTAGKTDTAVKQARGTSEVDSTDEDQ